MRFIETSVFTRLIVELLDDDAYRALQLAILARPDLGPAIPGSGGLRKLRRARGEIGRPHRPGVPARPVPPADRARGDAVPRAAGSAGCPLPRGGECGRG